MKKLVNRDLDLSIGAEAGIEAIQDFLKANGLKAGKKPLEELLAGKRDNVAGFEVVNFDDETPEEAETVEETVEEAPAETKSDPKASDADEKPAFSDDEVAKAIEEAKAKGVEVQTTKPVDEEKPKAAAKTRAPKEIKAVAPKGKIKAVRKGTKIANGLELMLAGTTVEDLKAAQVSDDIVDFVNRRVTKRGYGVSLTDGKIGLVLPEGVTAITYGGSAD